MGFRVRKIEESAKHSFPKILVRVKISIYPIPNSTVFSHLQTSWGKSGKSESPKSPEDAALVVIVIIQW